jgi:hypothetical protein
MEQVTVRAPVRRRDSKPDLEHLKIYRSELHTGSRALLVADPLRGLALARHVVGSRLPARRTDRRWNGAPHFDDHVSPWTSAKVAAPSVRAVAAARVAGR